MSICNLDKCIKRSYGQYCPMHYWRLKHWGQFDKPVTYRQHREPPQNYSYIHTWLTRTYGRADHCENPSCKGLSKRFEWAKLTGLRYERKRENFMQLCKQCHGMYDRGGKPVWNSGTSQRYKNCEQCGIRFHYLKTTRRFCSNSCSSKSKAASGGLAKSWATRRLKLQEAK